MIDTEFLNGKIKEIENPVTAERFGQCGEQISIELETSQILVRVTMGYPIKSQAEALGQLITGHLELLTDGVPVHVTIDSKIVAHAAQGGIKLLPNVKNVIAVASGKGGVGKSTTTTNLAIALASEGAQVGVLDADIYGPSQQMMLGLEGKPESEDGKSITPFSRHGIQAMSIGTLVDPDQPMVWRGPMVTQALEQLLRDTKWKDLDYLLIDLPPGTGDIQLTLSQKVPLTGAIIVTTPQDIALIDARKALKMFEKVHVPLLGIVENMSMHTCSNCGHVEHIFGEGGGGSMASDYGVDMLGSLPLDISIREDLDRGEPSLVTKPDGPISVAYKEIALKVASKIAKQKRDYSNAFPNIKVQNN
jgi:ATP-binding protein involved in chromosome partitioning